MLAKFLAAVDEKERRLATIHAPDQVKLSDSAIGEGK